MQQGWGEWVREVYLSYQVPPCKRLSGTIQIDSDLLDLQRDWDMRTRNDHFSCEELLSA
jgi:hypothetical protein